MPLDEAAATEWFRKAAEQDYRVAQYGLGKCYVEGVGVPQDDAEATTWLKKVIKDDDVLGDSMQRRSREMLEKIKERQEVAPDIPLGMSLSVEKMH